MKDIVGREVKVGDIVAHGQRSGNGGMVSLKVVTDARPTEHEWLLANDYGEVRVQGYRKVDHVWNKDTHEFDDTPEHLEIQRGGWTTTDSLIVVTESVPQDIREFLQSQV